MNIFEKLATEAIRQDIDTDNPTDQPLKLNHALYKEYLDTLQIPDFKGEHKEPLIYKGVSVECIDHYGNN